MYIYLSPPVNTTPYTFSYSLGGLFGMSTYPIAPRVTPIPIGLPVASPVPAADNTDKPFVINGKILHSPGNGFQQWIKFKDKCTPTFTIRLCVGGIRQDTAVGTAPYISCYKKGTTPITSTEILETRKSIGGHNQF